MPLQLLRKHPEVRSRSRQRFRVVLVDEYQDSNMAQFELLRELWEPGIYLCVVGDDDQSIYGFRGAEVGNILSFPKVFPGTEVVRLERNYRSTQSILDVASAVVANNKERLGKTLWTENAAGELPTVSCLVDQDEEADFCARIARDDFDGTTAILYRMNAQSLPFEDRFRKLGIRFRLVGTVRFYEREEVKDALAYLSLLVNPNDEVAFRRVVNRPGRGIGAVSVEKMVESWRARDGAGTDLLASCRRASGRLGVRARSGRRGFPLLSRGLVRPRRGAAARRARPVAPVAHGAVRDVPDAGTSPTTPTRRRTSKRSSAPWRTPGRAPARSPLSWRAWRWPAPWMARRTPTARG